MSDDEDQRDAPPSQGRRLFEMAKMTASVAGDYTSSRIKSWFQGDEAGEQSRAEARRRSGERVAETLGELKGAAMKIGQMASVATDVLPEELAEPLEELQRDAPPMEYEVVAEQVEAELGAAPGLLFEEFDREPFASASIGQVHRAKTDDGRRAVVKVQYPGIDESVGTDLAQLKTALRVSGLVSSEKREAFDRLFDEIEARLEEELDYTQEADNVRLFGRLHADDSDLVIPEVIGERSAKRVLTLTEERGDDLETVRETYSWSEKDAIGERLFRMFGDQLFLHRTIHADPNPANFAFRRDGTIVVYDFGCIKRLESTQHEALVEVTRAALEADWDGLEAALQKLGARVPGTPAVPDETYETWRNIFVGPILEEEYYDYGEEEVYRRFREHVDTFIEYEDRFQPPPGGVYIDRTVVGLYNLLRKLECELPSHALVREYLEVGEREMS